MTSSEARHSYTIFRKSLLRQNFIQLQNSLYVRHFPTLSAAEAVIVRLRLVIPHGAQLTFFIVTDKQYGMTKEFLGSKPIRKKPNATEQIELF